MNKKIGQFYIYRNPTPSSCEVLTRQINDNLNDFNALWMPIHHAHHVYLGKYDSAMVLAGKLGAKVGEYPKDYYVTLEASKRIEAIKQEHEKQGIIDEKKVGE